MRDPIAESNERISDRATIRDLEDRLGKEVRSRRAAEAKVRELEEERRPPGSRGPTYAEMRRVVEQNRVLREVLELHREDKCVAAPFVCEGWCRPCRARDALARVEEEDDG